MAQQKKAKSGDTDMKDRRNVAVKLTVEELKELRQMALDTDSSSIDLVTTAVREMLRKHFAARK
jgi:hypothetical protein